MASEQISQNEFIAQAVAEATRIAIQTMATTGMARQEKCSIGEQRISMKSCKTSNLK